MLLTSPNAASTPPQQPTTCACQLPALQLPLPLLMLPPPCPYSSIACVLQAQQQGFLLPLATSAGEALAAFLRSLPSSRGFDRARRAAAQQQAAAAGADAAGEEAGQDENRDPKAAASKAAASKAAGAAVALPDVAWAAEAAEGWLEEVPAFVGLVMGSVRSRKVSSAGAAAALCGSVPVCTSAAVQRCHGLAWAVQADPCWQSVSTHPQTLLEAEQGGCAPPGHIPTLQAPLVTLARLLHAAGGRGAAAAAGAAGRHLLAAARGAGGVLGRGAADAPPGGAASGASGQGGRCRWQRWHATSCGAAAAGPEGQHGGGAICGGSLCDGCDVK